MNIVKVKAIINVIITLIFFTICLVASNHIDTSEQDITQKITVIPKQVEEPKAISDISTDIIIVPEPREIQDIIPQTTYDMLTDDEIHLIEATVQHEVGNFSETYQTLIAELIYNRLMSDQFPNTIKEVLYQEGQFCGIEDWYRPDIIVNDTTKNIVKSVFSKDTTSHDALYYYNPRLSTAYAVEWFEHSGDVEYLFEHIEVDWDVEYKTRFFK